MLQAGYRPMMQVKVSKPAKYIASEPDRLDKEVLDG